MKSYTLGITKEEFVAEMKLHQKLDNFIKGTYNDKLTGKACAVGCSLMSIAKLKGIKLNLNHHIAMEKNGICPEWLAKLEDVLFEGLPKERYKKWPVEFAEAINTGANLDNIKVPFINYIVKQNLSLLDELDTSGDTEIEKSIKVIRKAGEKMLKGGVGAAEKASELRLAKKARNAAWETIRAKRAWDTPWAMMDVVAERIVDAVYIKHEIRGCTMWWSSILREVPAVSMTSLPIVPPAPEQFADELLRLIRSEV